MDIFEVIDRRQSVRTYNGKNLSLKNARSIKDRFEDNVGPFGTEVGLKLVDLSRTSNRRLGTYGVIKGARAYIGGRVPVGEKSFEDFGFVMEKLVLHCTKLELGTCWLGGTYNRGAFAKELGVEKDEAAPAIVSVGVPSDKSNIVHSVFKRTAKSTKRRPWNKLFYQDNYEKPLSKKKAGDFEKVLEAVRWAPSGSNKQPWRIIRHDGNYHFYLRRTGSRIKMYKVIQLVDMGIAVCHFDLTARELGLTGTWVVSEPKLDSSFWEYNCSFISSDRP